MALLLRESDVAALIKVYSRSTERREAFAEEMVTELGIEVVTVESAEDAVADTDIVVTATNARHPVLLGAWLRPGVHVNAIGSDAWDRATELGAIVAGKAPGRQHPDEITLFESQGIATEDVVTLDLLYRRAVATGAGMDIPLTLDAVKAR